jgi:hypothetical protein
MISLRHLVKSVSSDEILAILVCSSEAVVATVA